MYARQFNNVNRTYSNAGMHAQQVAEFNLLGKVKSHDDGRYNKCSDLDELKISVKATGFSLAAARLFEGDTFEAQLEEFFANSHSEIYLYITEEFIGYFMNPEEFKEFIKVWCYFTEESREKNKGGMKIRCKHESQKMRKWLAARV